MRPCNYCGKPVGNDRFLCDSCRASFESQKVEPPKHLYQKQADRLNQEHSRRPIQEFLRSDTFALIVILTPAMTGAAMGLWYLGPIWALTGFLVGLLLGVLFVFRGLL